MRQNEILRQQLNEDVEAYLKKGGKIKKLEYGETGIFADKNNFVFSEYHRKVKFFERKHNRPFWDAVQEYVEKGYTKAQIAAIIEMQPSEFSYLIKRDNRGHLWASGKRS